MLRRPLCVTGIGKSLFLYYFMWLLARAGATVVYDRRDTMPVHYSSSRVCQGPLDSFQSMLENSDTWSVPCTLCSVAFRWLVCCRAMDAIQSPTFSMFFDAWRRYLVDGKSPRRVNAKTVLVTSPDWDVWKVGSIKASCDCLQLMICPLPVVVRLQVYYIRSSLPLNHRKP